MDSINEIFDKYREVTKAIIEKVNADTDEDVSLLMEKRQRLIDKISQMPISADEKKKVYKNLDIKKYDEELGEILNQKLGELKKQIKRVSKSRNAFSTYQANMGQQNFFSRKV